MRRPIRISEPDLSGNELRYASEAIKSTWISSSGTFVDRFEREFAELCECEDAISVCNGTAALHLALVALDVGPGDEVIVPSLTFIATANAVKYTGATPVFADVDPDTWCLTASGIKRVLSPRTRAVIPVHLFGVPCDMDEIMALAIENTFVVVEDCAEAHGATIDGHPVGRFGHMGTFSFYGNKILSCGEGGAIVASDDAWSDRLRLFRGQGMDPKRRYFHPVVGFNYRLTNVACAILCAQIERFDAMLQRRREICAQYREGLEGIVRFQEVPAHMIAAPWVTAVAFDTVADQMIVERGLSEAMIETRPFFHPMHTQPPYATDPSKSLPISEELAPRGLCLPTHTGLYDGDVQRVIDVIRSYCV